MSSSNLERMEQLLEEHGTSVEAIEVLYTKLYERTMHLSVTKVAARQYFYWKKSGLIDNDEVNEDDKGWIKINLIEFVWIKAIVIMRDFGVPFEKIKEVKVLMFANFMVLATQDPKGQVSFLQEESNQSVHRTKETEEILAIGKEEMDRSPEEFTIYHTVLGHFIMELLVRNDKAYFAISKNEDAYDVKCFTTQSISDFKKLVQPIFETPFLCIPIESLIKEFLGDIKTEKFVEEINLLNLKEMKVIKAMRAKDFKNIVIKRDGKNDYEIEVEKDGDIMDQKAKEVKRILGLDNYSEVTITYRNDKHLYFKKTKRM